MSTFFVYVFSIIVLLNVSVISDIFFCLFVYSSL